MNRVALARFALNGEQQNFLAAVDLMRGKRVAEKIVRPSFARR